MCRRLNTGKAGDLNMAALDSLEVHVGVVDDRSEIGPVNNSQQRFSDEFVLKFE